MNEYSLGDLIVKGDISDTYSGTYKPTNELVYIVIADKKNADQAIDIDRFDILHGMLVFFCSSN